MNEIETEGLVNTAESANNEPQVLLDELHSRYPQMRIVMTLGGDGVMYQDSDLTIAVAAEKIDVVDTTAAGDTFIGYFIQQCIAGKPAKTALEVANKASSMTVQTLGASESIPDMKTLQTLGLV